jgi:N-acetylglucosamine kinase-like BadF-type ATPase
MTRAIIVNRAHQVLGEGTAGPSNPLRVGVGSAAAAVREAFDKACDAARVQRSEIVAAEIGLAGVRRADVRVSMYNALKVLGISEMEVVTDADIALFGATNGEPGLVIIAGTGSICCGRSTRGKRVCAGGWGPLAGDEGSGSWISRQALRAVARASDGRGPGTSLAQAACKYFNVPQPEDLSMAIYAPSMTNDRVAGFGKQVVEAAQDGDAVAREIILHAGRELGTAASAVIRGLHMERERFQVAYVGGVFKAGELLLEPLREEIKRLAPKAYLAPPLMAPVVAAARMAREHLEHIALAV